MAVTAKKLKEYLRLPPDTFLLKGDANVDFDTFVEAVEESGTYTFIKGDGGWALNGSAVTLSEYGIEASEEETEIVIKYDNEEVDIYLQAAKSKARTAGIRDFQNNAQYDMFVLALAGLYYDNRGIGFADPSVEAAAKRMVDAFVLELRYAKEDSSMDGD